MKHDVITLVSSQHDDWAGDPQAAPALALVPCVLPLDSLFQCKGSPSLSIKCYLGVDMSVCGAQGEMESLREQLDTIASTAGASVDQAALAGSSALSVLHSQHTSYAQTAQEASLSSIISPQRCTCMLSIFMLHH